MNLLLRLDRESFDALKELLREKSRYKQPNDSTDPQGRLTDRDSLKRVFEQMRDMNYGDYVLPVSLDYE